MIKSSRHQKITGDFGNAIEGVRIGDRLPLRIFAKNSWLCNFRLLQTISAICEIAVADSFWSIAWHVMEPSCCLTALLIVRVPEGVQSKRP